MPLTIQNTHETSQIKFCQEQIIMPLVNKLNVNKILVQDVQEEHLIEAIHDNEDGRDHINILNDDIVTTYFVIQMDKSSSSSSNGAAQYHMSINAHCMDPKFQNMLKELTAVYDNLIIFKGTSRYDLSRDIRLSLNNMQYRFKSLSFITKETIELFQNQLILKEIQNIKDPFTSNDLVQTPLFHKAIRSIPKDNLPRSLAFAQIIQKIIMIDNLTIIS